jgi:DNA repair and recombination protein RAD54 and RAD54-like protein
MLRQLPTTRDGQTVHRLQESHRINRPFRPPSFNNATENVKESRKRRRVSYKEQDISDDLDEAEGRRKKKKDNDKSYCNEEELLSAIQKFPVYTPKPFHQLHGRRFSMPSMRTKDGEIIAHPASNMSLGIRPQAKIIPRPLHDPMEDHAIVLYDPTIDDRETDEERKEREKEEARQRAEKEALEKTAGMHNPHKSLRKLLGEDKAKQEVPKVPVVIDPRLSKVLRPHQVEGVKVSS